MVDKRISKKTVSSRQMRQMVVQRLALGNAALTLEQRECVAREGLRTLSWMIRNLPRLSQAINMTHNDLLSVLQRCPESPFFANLEMCLDEASARKEVVKMVDRAKFGACSEVDEADSSQEQSINVSLQEEAKPALVADLNEAPARDERIIADAPARREGQRIEAFYLAGPQIEEEKVADPVMPRTAKEHKAEGEGENEGAAREQAATPPEVQILADNFPQLTRDRIAVSKAVECADFLQKKGIWKKVLNEAALYHEKISQADPKLKKRVHAPDRRLWIKVPRVEQK